MVITELTGICTEEEYEELYPQIQELLLNYIATLIPYWKMKPTLEEMIDADDIIKWQIEFIMKNGGRDIFSGRSDLDIRQVQTEGFSYQVNSGGHLEYFDGIPIAPLVSSSIKRQLRMKGYMCQALC